LSLDGRRCILKYRDWLRDGSNSSRFLVDHETSALFGEYLAMGRVNDTISNVNSAFRNLLLMVLIAGAGIGGYKAYDLYNAPRQQLADKQAELDKAVKDLEKTSGELREKVAQVERLEVSMKLLKVRHRIARLTVIDQHEAASLNPVTPTQGTEVPPSRANVLTKVQFTEVDENGQPIGPAKEFEIVGDMVYVDFLRVTFDDKYIEQSDLDRSTSLVLFQRIFGEHQEPVKGFQLETVGTRPTAYGRGTPMSDFEKKIWSDFWLIANDPQCAADMGIRAAHGDAVSMRVKPGKTYEIDLRSTGEISVRTMETPATPVGAPTAGK
jgi:hypothetical protein